MSELPFYARALFGVGVIILLLGGLLVALLLFSVLMDCISDLRRQIDRRKQHKAKEVKDER